MDLTDLTLVSYSVFCSTIQNNIESAANDKYYMITNITESDQSTYGLANAIGGMGAERIKTIYGYY